MRLWFQRIATYLGLEDLDAGATQAVLRTAAVRSASIGIGSIDGVALPSPLDGHVEAVDEDALVISRPFEGSIRRELVAGERLHLSIAGDDGFHHGEVEVLGRWTEGQGSTRRYGYRLSIPRALVHEERRNLHRVPVAFDLAPRAILVRPVSLLEIGHGTVLDLSEGGLCVRIDARSAIRPGDAVHVTADFPAVIPPIRAHAEVAHARPARQAPCLDLGLRFTEAQDELGRAIRALELRRVNRAGAA